MNKEYTAWGAAAVRLRKLDFQNFHEMDTSKPLMKSRLEFRDEIIWEEDEQREKIM